MGMYTEIVAGIQLKKATPQVVVDALDYMCGNTDKAPKKLPEHALFKNPEGRWAIMLQCSSHYFPYHESLTKFKPGPDYAPEHILSVRASVKNYSGEVEAFFDWIKRYADVSDPDETVLLGYSRYEEDEDPILYYTTKVVRVRA